MSKRWEQLAALTGLVGVALVVASFIVGGETPATDDPVEEVVSFYLDEEGSVLAGSILLGYGSLFLLFFVTRIRRALRGDEGTTARLSAVAFGGGLLMVAGLALFAGLGFALADAADDIDPLAVQTLNVLSSDLFMPLAVGNAALFIAIGIGTLRFGGFPRVLGWLALLIGICGVSPIGFFAFLAGLLWIAITSIYLCLNAEEGAPAGPG
jgi:hypothetical protein